uniref:Putative secreted protein n=1 Tax=Anopheles darlingi TaxID=43151 RepID=A0A2M4DBA9_ANODA
MQITSNTHTKLALVLRVFTICLLPRKQHSNHEPQYTVSIYPTRPVRYHKTQNQKEHQKPIQKTPSKTHNTNQETHRPPSPPDYLGYV